MSKAIPTNLITGFLGTGKTTAILHMLANKPEQETWAVLVNEFGEIGIDGALLEGAAGNGENGGRGIVVREVPGGCMCCVAGLPMQIGLNMLIARSQPDRLLIEPTGLGHPQEIINTLTGEYYSEVLDLRASICLVDPRHLSDVRYLENDNFRDQVNLSDVLVANKTDLCSAEDKARFEQFCQNLPDRKSLTGWVRQGQLKQSWLELPRTERSAANPHAHSLQKSTHKTHHQRQPGIMDLELSEGETSLRKENTGQGHFSCGWLFSENLLFSFDQLFSLIHSMEVLRLKAVMKTDQGARGFNMQDGVVSILEMDDCQDSRLEVIHSAPLDWDTFEGQLRQALIANPDQA